MYLTETDRVDAETMRLDNPERIVGSGFIQFPPQVPFQHQHTRQPPTATGYGGRGRGCSGYRGRGGRGGQMQYSNGPSQHGGHAQGYAGGGGHSAETYGRAGPSQEFRGRGRGRGRGRSYRDAQAGSAQSTGYRAEGPSYPAQDPIAPAGYGRSTQASQPLSHADSHTTNKQPQAVNEAQVNPSPAPANFVSAPANSRLPGTHGTGGNANGIISPQSHGGTGNDPSKSHLSKSQAKRHRKKLREGKIDTEPTPQTVSPKLSDFLAGEH